MEPNILSISSNTANVRQDVFPLGQWTVTTRKGIIMQSKCTCQQSSSSSNLNDVKREDSEPNIASATAESSIQAAQLCNICKYYKFLPQLHNMPDMLFNDNLLRLEHYTGLGIEFNALDALKLVEETIDPLQVAVAGGWQSARADFPFARKVVKPFDWTFTTNYRGTILNTINRNKQEKLQHTHKLGGELSANSASKNIHLSNISTGTETNSSETEVSGSVEPLAKQPSSEQRTGDQVCLTIEETDERIDVNKLKVREEILFYDDVTLYEDELADHGTAQYSVKVRVMPKSLFILARFYLRVDGVLARINDTRIYHELNKNYLLREYTNRETKLNSLNLPVSTLVNPNELMVHLPIIQSTYERLVLPPLR